MIGGELLNRVLQISGKNKHNKWDIINRWQSIHSLQWNIQNVTWIKALYYEQNIFKVCQYLFSCRPIAVLDMHKYLSRISRDYSLTLLKQLHWAFTPSDSLQGLHIIIWGLKKWSHLTNDSFDTVFKLFMNKILFSFSLNFYLIL